MTEKDNKEYCGICKKVIVRPGEEYVRLSQFNSDGSFYKEGFYHVTCFKEKYLVNKDVSTLMARTQRIMDKAEAMLH